MRSWGKRSLLAIVLFALFLVFGGAAQQAQAAQADEEVTFTLHKLLFKNGEVPAAIRNDGLADPFSEKGLSDSYTGLNGATFAIYDVTAAFYQKRAAGESEQQAQTELAQVTPSAAALQTKTTATVAKEAGIASFTVPAKEASGKKRDKAYLFIETNRPDNIVETAAPMVVILPVVTAGDQALTEIQLYPKNEDQPHENPPLTKTVTNDKTNVEYGATLSYKLTTVVPADVWSYKNYQLTDEADSALQLNSDSLQVTLSGKDTAAFSTVKTSAHGFVIDFDPEVLTAAIGKMITVTYDMRLTDTALTQSTFVNTATLIPGAYPKVTRQTTITTGGKRFVKVDLADQQKKLAGAEFIVENAKGQVLRRKDGTNSWLTAAIRDAAAARKAGALILHSDQTGDFAINGLAFGAYRLREIKAPYEYLLSKAPISFTVEENSYELGAKAALKIVNKEKPADLSNKKRHGLFPKTNETTSYGLILSGILVLIVVCLFFFKRRKK